MTRAISITGRAALTWPQGKFAEALKINRLIDRRPGIAANLNNLGVIAQAQGNPDQAVAYFQEALAINRELHDPAALSETLNNLGLAYLGQGRVGRPTRLSGSPGTRPAAAPPGALAGPVPDPPGGCGPGPQGLYPALNYYHQALGVADKAARSGAGPCAGSAWGAPSWT